MSRLSILIFSADALAAALMAGAVELAGHRLHFASPEEPARTALRRVRPDVVLIDCDHSESCADSFIGPAIMTGARAILFRSPHTRRDVRELTSHLHVTVLNLPDDAAHIADILASPGNDSH